MSAGSGEERQGRRFLLEGQVQGVGFRPFVYRLARELGVCGEVRNCLGRVEVLAEAEAAVLARFEAGLTERAPPLARPRLLAAEARPLRGFADFSIVASRADGDSRIEVPPDCFCCDDCLRELADPSDRRYGYPFINCTQCGPRYTLIRDLPYDRPNTSMAGFELCPQCLAEYRDPMNRRFHAEPLACPVCGPRLYFVAADGRRVDAPATVLQAALETLRGGRVLAVKGIGGYHLVCDARSEGAVARLRARKHRPHKPLAVMFPRTGADGLDAVRRYLRVEPVAAAALLSPQRPIVLVRGREATDLAPSLSPGLVEIGAMLPYSPLHQLLLAAFDGPLVATSGNLSGEPVLTDNDEVEQRLSAIADDRLHHDRPIVRPADDPVLRVIDDRARPIRVGRGNAPVELELPFELAEPTLAVGGHLKNTVCLAWGRRAVVSPHIGDMGTPRSLRVFEQVQADLQALYRVRARRLACDRHPGYTTTRWAARNTLPEQAIWHHHAHASALAGELGDDDGPWLVFTWDGVGLGEDGTLWGGEALYGGPGGWRRVAGWRPFRLPGGELAGREPWRSAAALCWEAGLRWQPAGGAPDPLLYQAWQRGLNAPFSGAVGRLFDAAAALCGLAERTSFEGQGPMWLEALADGRRVEGLALPMAPDADGVLRSDWAPLLAPMLDRSMTPAERAVLWHASLARAIADQARSLSGRFRIARVGLCGGVFQNRLLSEAALQGLRAAGFRASLAARLPANDAAISFGQVVELAARDQLAGAEPVGSASATRPG